MTTAHPARPDLAGRVAIVTAAGSGIGRTVAEALASAGASVCCADVSAPAAAVTASAIVAGGGDAIERSVDVAEREELEHLARSLVAERGRIDVWCNVADALTEGRMLDLDEHALDRLVATNVRGTLWGCQASASVMTARGTGSIVNVVVAPAGPTAAASLIEGAVVAMTAQLAAELSAAGVRVNAVAADLLAAPVLPAHWPGAAVAVAAAVTYLASDASWSITGQCLRPGTGVATDSPPRSKR